MQSAETTLHFSMTAVPAAMFAVIPALDRLSLSLILHHTSDDQTDNAKDSQTYCYCSHRNLLSNAGLHTRCRPLYFQYYLVPVISFKSAFNVLLSLYGLTSR